MKKQKKILSLFLLIWTGFLVVSGLESFGYFTAFNTRVENLAIFFRYESLVEFFRVITFLGSWEFVFPVCLVIALFLWRYKKYKYLFPLILSTFVSHFSSTFLKLIMEKERPFSPLVSENSFSFPSSHAVIAIAFYGLITYFLLKILKKKWQKILVFVIGAFLIYLISLSRIYLTVHYFSDVLGGFLLGLSWMTLSVLWFKNFVFKKNYIFVFASCLFLFNAIFFNILPKPPVPVIANTVITEDVLKTFDKEKLPRYTEKPRGGSQHPLSFFIVAKNDQELIDVFALKGWVLTERLTPQTIYKLAITVIQDKPYPKGPITPSLWNKDTQDFSFAKPTEENTIRIRHHCRFWKTNIKTKEGKSLYVGSATFDYGIQPWLITHKVASDIDTERDFLFNDLLKTGRVKSYKKFSCTGPCEGRNFQLDFFYSDGNAYLIEFK
jgi:membrane-associated phospholipid phosphatase